MIHRLIAITMTAGLLLAAGPGTASAQTGAPYSPARYQPPKQRDGITLGFAGGVGELSCEDKSPDGTGPCEGVTKAGSLDAHLGLLLNPKLAIMGDAWVMAHKGDTLTVSQTIITGALQLWLTPRLWVKGGLGVAYVRFKFNVGGVVELQSHSDSVPAGMLAAGYELMHKPNFALDIAFRVGTGIYKDDQTRAQNVALTLGLNWY